MSREIIYFGIIATFFGACFGVDEPGQFILFAFGISWGRMFDYHPARHDEARKP